MLPDDHSEAIEQTLAFTQDYRLRTRWAYYDGNHPRIYVTPKMRETFRDLADSLIENYCGLAINSRISRLQVTGFDGPAADAAESIWTAAGFPQRQDVMYRWALVHGQATLLVQDDTLTANPANIAYAHPDPNDWMKVAWAGKVVRNNDIWSVTLWDEERLYRYTAAGQTTGNGYTNSIVGADTFRPTEDYEEFHGYGQVPAFIVSPYGYQGSPLIDQISPIQDRINKITANKFVAAEFGAFKQRIFFTRQQLDPHAVRQQPDHAIVLDPGEQGAQARVQEMTASDLSNYDNAKTAEVDALFTIATLPRHMRVNPGSAPSGEAIKADEGPFVEALIDHQREMGEAITAAMALMNKDATPIWRDVEVHNELNNAQMVRTLVESGIPWTVAAQKYLGWTPDEIAEAMMIQGAQQGGVQSQVAQQAAALLSNPLLQP